jgi:hypothetical protein
MVALEVVVEEVFAKRAVDVLLMRVMGIGLVVRPVGAIEGKLLVVVGAAHI